MAARTLAISDEALLAFIRWCRINDVDLVENIDVARNVLDAYRRSVR